MNKKIKKIFEKMDDETQESIKVLINHLSQKKYQKLTDDTIESQDDDWMADNLAICVDDLNIVSKKKCNLIFEKDWTGNLISCTNTTIGRIVWEYICWILAGKPKEYKYEK
jgi:hypothetical protein